MRLTARLNHIKEVGEYFLLNYGIRTTILLSIVVLAIFPGAFLRILPSGSLTIFAIVFTTLTVALTFPIMSIIRGPLLTLCSGFNKKYNAVEYDSPLLQQLKNKMGIKKVKTYLTDNPDIIAYTNLFTKKIYVQKQYFEGISLSEVEANTIFAHEFVHVKTAKKFILEIVIAFCGVYAFSEILSFYTVPIIVFSAEIASLILVISFLSRRNESRADKEGAKAGGIANMIAVFEYFLAKFKKDEESETHPSLRKRIDQLMAISD